MFTDGNTIEIDYLLSKGADVNAKDNSGWTAFIYAYHNEHSDKPRLDLLEHLIKKGADVNVVYKDGRTILDLVEPDSEIAKFLRRNGGKGKVESVNQALVSHNFSHFFYLRRH